MTPREVIRTNLECAGGVRIGMNFSGGRWNDFVGGALGPVPGYEPRRWTEGTIEYYDDEWGNIWHRVLERSRGGEIYRPALREWSDFERYKTPDIANPTRFAAAAEAFRQEDQKFRLGYLPGFPFAICRYLRKMENYFADLLWERQNVGRLHGIVTDLLEEMITRWAEAGADGIIFCEDWGVQNRLLIHPDMWREVFKPLFRRLCSAARSRGMFVIMHSCGYVYDILDDLAEVGIHAMQFDQPALYGLECLSAKLRSCCMALHAPVDIQRVLPTGDRSRIEKEARRMVELFQTGFIAKDYPDLHGIGVAPEWDTWAYEVFVEAASTAA